MKHSPAFIYGILFLLGIAFALSFHVAYFIPLAFCLWISRKMNILVCLSGFLWAFFSYTLPQLPEVGIEGTGKFVVESVGTTTSPFQRSIAMKGVLKEFNGMKNIPCRIHFKEKKPRPTGDLQVTGRLIPKGKHHYVLKPTSAESIGTSLAEWRFELKNKLRSHLSHHFKNSKTRAFLLSMLTGEIDDRLLSLEFNRLGILHLLGISGFQFALLAFLLGTGFRLFLPYRLAYILLMTCLTAYAFILGDSPPIERAWLGIMLYFTALLCGLRISPLNALGVALIVQLIKDPLLIFHLGFQFSFLCTVAILTLYPWIRQGLLRFLPQRSFKEVLQMPLLDQHGHLLAFFCRETVALNAAIHLATLPLILYHFHKFPVLSLFYNLFLPAAVSVVYLLLILGLVIPWFHLINKAFTELIVKIATHPPALYDFQWRMNLSMTAAVIALTVILGASLFRERLYGLIERAHRRIVAMKV